MKRFDDLTEAEILALAITSEEEDAHIYLNFAAKLREQSPATADKLKEMAAQEQDHRHRLLSLYRARFGEELPYITREDVRGFYKRNPIWLLPDLRLETVRRQTRQMESQAQSFYARAAERTNDLSTRRLLADLAAEEQKHEALAMEFVKGSRQDADQLREDENARRLLLLRIVQPGLAGLIDGSISTLAPIFAAAFAMQDTFSTFLVGLAASVGAGISMGLTEALSDDGIITDRGHPWLRGTICGVMTAVGGLGHTMPFLIPDFTLATIVALIVVVIELFAIAGIRWKYMETPFASAVVQVILGGLLVLATGILIGSA